MQKKVIRVHAPSSKYLLDEILRFLRYHLSRYEQSGKQMSYLDRQLQDKSTDEGECTVENTGL